MVPYTRGGLVSRAHREGEVLSAEHTEQGTLPKARAGPEPASALRACPGREPVAGAASHHLR